MDSQQNSRAAALKQAHDAGVLTDAEYQQKLDALRGGPAATGVKPASAGAGKGSTWHMKRAAFRQNTALEAMPQWGLPGRPGKDVDALSMLIPADWTFQAGGAPPPFDCNLTSGRLFAVTAAPDKTAGLLIIPGKASLWSNDRSILQSVQANNQQFQRNTNCVIQQPVPLAQAIVQIARGMVKDIDITAAMQPVPGLSDKLPAMLAEANRNLAQGGARMEATAGRIPYKSVEGGVPAVGYLTVLQVVKTERMPNGAMVVTTDYPMQIVTFAPTERYAAMEPMFNAMLDSVVVDPDYAAQSAQTSQMLLSMHQQTMAKLQQIQSQIAADAMNGARQRQNLIMQERRYENESHNAAFQQRTAALDHSAQQFSMYLSGEQVYRNPETGARVKMSNQYNHAWASGNGTDFILTDNPTYNPNGLVGNQGWTQMQVER